jgi:IPT/TIG domain/Dockerin type I domain
VQPGGASAFENTFIDENSLNIVPVGFPGTVEIIAPTLPPTITAVDPTSGPSAGGATVLVTGTGFTADLEVRFGANDASSSGILVLSSLEALVVTPPGSPGAVGVRVQTALGEATLADAYTYVELTVISAVPSTVNACVEVPLVLHGTGFPPGLRVRFGEAYAMVLDVDPAGTSAEVIPPAFPLASPSGVQVVPVTVEIPGSDESAVLPGGVTYAVEFIRGDVNGDGAVDAADLSYLGSALAGTGPLPANFDSADVNDDGLVHIGDQIALSAWLFQGGAPPPAPFPGSGIDPTPDGLCP